jgi:putative addiction module component (TIGR02574 family)
LGVNVKNLGIDQLGIEERLALIDEIWSSVCADAPAFPLTDAQRKELDRRLADDDARPDDVVPWEDARQSIQQRLSIRGAFVSSCDALPKRKSRTRPNGMTERVRA